MPRFDRTIRVSILWDRGHHRHKNDIINNNSITNGMLNPRRNTRWFLVDRRKTKWNIFHPCVPVIDFDEGRAGWELMIANRGLHRSQPIWITLHRSTVPLRIVHDRFSCSASLSLSLSLSLPLSSSLSLYPSFYPFLIDLAFVHNRFHARPNFVTLSGGEHCGSDLLYTRSKQGARDFWIRLVGVFAPWKQVYSLLVGSPGRFTGFMAYGRVLLTRFEWMLRFLRGHVVYVSKSIVSVVSLEKWLHVSYSRIRSCL